MSDADEPTNLPPSLEKAELMMRANLVELEHRFSEKAKDRLQRHRLELTPERLRWGIILEDQGITEIVLDALDTLYLSDPEEALARVRRVAAEAQNLPDEGLRFLLERGLSSAAHTLIEGLEEGPDL